MFALIQSSTWLTLTCTVHDWESFNQAPAARDMLQRELEASSHRTSSADYLQADDPDVLEASVVYIGDEREVKQAKVSKHAFALHGATQKAAHDMLHASQLPFAPEGLYVLFG